MTQHTYSREAWVRGGVKIFWCTCGFSGVWVTMREHWKKVDRGET